MSVPVPSFADAVVVRFGGAEVLGWTSVMIRLLADSSDTGGALSVMRTGLAAGVEAAKPHTHTRSAELFFVLEGQAEILTGDSVLTASQGDLVVVPPDQVHAFGTPQERTAELLIVQAPGLERFGYFRLIERLMQGQATISEVMATQEQYDNHFVASDVWDRRSV